jgi:hypothetical protein
MSMLVTSQPGSAARPDLIAQVMAPPSLTQQVSAAVAASSLQRVPALTSTAASAPGVRLLLQGAQGFVPKVKEAQPALTGALHLLNSALPPASSLQRYLMQMTPAQRTVVANTALLLLEQHQLGNLNRAEFRLALQQLLQREPGISVQPITPAGGSLQASKPPPPRAVETLPAQRMTRIAGPLEPRDSTSNQQFPELPAEVQKELEALKLDPSRTIRFWDPNDPLQTLMHNIAHASAEQLEAILGEIAEHAPLFYKWLMQQPWFTTTLADKIASFSPEQRQSLAHALERIESRLAADWQRSPTMPLSAAEKRDIDNGRYRLDTPGAPGRDVLRRTQALNNRLQQQLIQHIDKVLQASPGWRLQAVTPQGSRQLSPNLKLNAYRVTIVDDRDQTQPPLRRSFDAVPRLEASGAAVAFQFNEPSARPSGGLNIMKSPNAWEGPTLDSSPPTGATATDTDASSSPVAPNASSPPSLPVRPRIDASVVPPGDPTLIRGRNGWEMTYAPPMTELLRRFPGLVVGVAGGHDAARSHVVDGLAERLYRDPLPAAQLGATINVPAVLSRGQVLRLTVERAYKPHAQSRVVQLRVENLATGDSQSLVLKVEKPGLATSGSGLLPYPDVVKMQNMLSADPAVARAMRDNHVRFAQVYMTLDRGAAHARSPASFLLSEYVHPEELQPASVAAASVALERFTVVANRSLNANPVTRGVIIDSKLRNINVTRNAAGQPEYVIVDPFARGRALDSEGSPTGGGGPSNGVTAKRPSPPLVARPGSLDDAPRMQSLPPSARPPGASDASIAEARIKQLLDNVAQARYLMTLSPQQPLVWTYLVPDAVGSSQYREVKETIARDTAAGGHLLTVGEHEVAFQVRNGRIHSINGVAVATRDGLIR